MIMRSSSKKRKNRLQIMIKKQFHDVRITHLELFFVYLFCDSVDFFKFFFGERSMSDDTDIV